MSNERSAFFSFHMCRVSVRTLAASAALALFVALTTPAESSDCPASLKIGVVQFKPVSEYERNRDKMADFIRQAKAAGCRLVVFPERALYFTEDIPLHQIEATIDQLRAVVDEADLYAVICSWRHDGVKPHNQLVVVDPQGKIIQTYNKLWYDDRFNEAPGPFEIDGVKCAAAICADRWIRSVEELPAMVGAKILIECSNNYDNEWINELGWYWYVPRALRNETYVVFSNTSADSHQRPGELPGHGHSAVIAPDGRLMAAAGGESDRMLVVELDLAKATGGEAARRHSHPLFKPFWDTGMAILGGRKVAAVSHHPLSSPEVSLKIAAAQMPCSQRIDDNLRKMIEMIRAAANKQADVVVFPELAVTGARDADIRAATQSDIDGALATLQQAARDAKIHVACGLPWQEDDRRYNSAVVIDPQGKILTRYDQVVVDRPGLFAVGNSTKAMWFEIRGVPAVVTIGHDALWSEIAEMAALRGAQVHLHLAYDQDTSSEGQLRRKQLWVNLASFDTFTATVNAASPAQLEFPSAPAAGGSAIWEDFQRTKAGASGGYFPHSAVRLAEASNTETIGKENAPFDAYAAMRLAEAQQKETIVYATQKVQKTNPQFLRMTGTTNPQMTPWYATGAQVIYDAVSAPAPVER